MMTKTFKEQVTDLACGICKFKAWCEFDARERNAGADVDPIEDCGHIRAILTAHNAELDRIAEGMPTIKDDVITYELDHAHEPCGLEFRDEPKIRAVIRRENKECQAYIQAQRGG